MNARVLYDYDGIAEECSGHNLDVSSHTVRNYVLYNQVTAKAKKEVIDAIVRRTTVELYETLKKSLEEKKWI